MAPFAVASVTLVLYIYIYIYILLLDLCSLFSRNAHAELAFAVVSATLVSFIFQFEFVLHFFLFHHSCVISDSIPLYSKYTRSFTVFFCCLVSVCFLSGLH